MDERLTWNEIVEQYPQQYVYLIDIIWEDDRAQDVQSAVVIHATARNDDIEYVNRAVRGECVEEYTDLEGMATMGVLTL